MRYSIYKNLYDGKKYDVSISFDMNDLYLLPTINIAFVENYLEFAWLFFEIGFIKK